MPPWRRPVEPYVATQDIDQRGSEKVRKTPSRDASQSSPAQASGTVIMCRSHMRRAIRASSDPGTSNPEWFTVTRLDHSRGLRRWHRAVRFHQAFGWVVRPAVDAATISCLGGRRRVSSRRYGQKAGSGEQSKNDDCARKHICISQMSAGSRFARTTPSNCGLTRRRQVTQQDQGNDGEHRNDPEHSAEIDRDTYIAPQHIRYSL